MEEDIGLGQYEETDLGLYIDILVRRWYLVLIPALVLALGTIGVLSQRPLRYEARALVAIARWTTQVSYGTAIETVSDDRGGFSAAGLLRPTMTNALAGLMLGVMVALSLEWWKGYRLRSVGQTGAARMSNPDD